MRTVFAMTVAALAAKGYGQDVPGSRAPGHGLGAVERRGLILDQGDPAWQFAAIRGVPDRALVIPASLPGDPLQLGVNSIPPKGPISARSAGVLAQVAGQAVWRVRVDAPGSEAVRLRLSGLDLGPGESVVVAGRGMGYVIKGRGANGDGVEWTPLLDGESAYVEWRGGVPRFSIDEVSQIRWPDGGVTDLLPCHVDVRCETVDPVARDSVGMMIYSTGAGTFACTGGLLNDTDPGTTLGWFLTSNRCINTQAAASSLTVYWFYQTPTCNGTPPDPQSLPISQGAQLLVNTATTDASFLKLSQDPAQGQGLAGWTSGEPVGTVTTMHHPLATHKRIARGAATTQLPICFGTNSPYQFHYIDYVLGITEAGSTGAPLFNSNSQVVGQLFGMCSNGTPDCNNTQSWNAVFGKFGRTLHLIGGYLTGQVSPARVYVNAAATGAGTGLSWADAYTSLSAALAGAVPPAGGMEVWVASGTYKPAATVGRESALSLISNVAVYGGFSGNETALSQRNVGANSTILSGDLAGDDAPNFGNRGDNVYHVVRATGVDSTAVLDGFTISGGNANGTFSFNDKGGGVYVEGASPRIRNCTMKDSSAVYGGGAFAGYLGTMDLVECTFKDNRANFGGAISLTTGGGTAVQCLFESNISIDDGGAVDLFESAPTFTSCEFRDNLAGRNGGGISTFVSSGVVIDACRFDGNSSGTGGGAVYLKQSTGTLRGCTVVDNSTAHFGGGVLTFAGSNLSVMKTRFLGNVSGEQGGAVHANSGSVNVSNSEFSGNQANLSGGAYFHNKGCQTTLLNCTFSRNTAVTLAGGAEFDSGAGTLVNCILWGNTDSTGSGQSAQVLTTVGGTASFAYSLLQGWTGSLGGPGNIGGDPLFASATGLDGVPGTEDDNLELGSESPARDAGDTPASMNHATDLRGNSRRVDDTCRPDTGIGPAPVVDMGAIEGATCGCYANCDASVGSPLLTGNDFTCFLNAYVTNQPYANCDGSTGNPVLTGNDFTCFINEFAVGCQ